MNVYRSLRSLKISSNNTRNGNIPTIPRLNVIWSASSSNSASSIPPVDSTLRIFINNWPAWMLKLVMMMLSMPRSNHVSIRMNRAAMLVNGLIAVPRASSRTICNWSKEVLLQLLSDIFVKLWWKANFKNWWKSFNEKLNFQNIFVDYFNEKISYFYLNL